MALQCDVYGAVYNLYSVASIHVAVRTRQLKLQCSRTTIYTSKNFHIVNLTILLDRLSFVGANGYRLHSNESTTGADASVEALKLFNSLTKLGRF